MKSNQKFVLFGLILFAVVAAIFAFRSGKDFGREALLSSELYYELSDASEDLKDLDNTMDRVRHGMFSAILPLPIDQIYEIGYITGTSELNNEVFFDPRCSKSPV
jgi:hypothetical protein